MLDVETLNGLRSALPADRFDEIVRLFHETGRRYLAEMEAALGEGRVLDVDRAAHTLKSSAALMGARALAGTCRDIEATARAGTLPEASVLERARVEFESSLEGIQAALD